jgi:hypothetical protein
VHRKDHLVTARPHVRLVLTTASALAVLAGCSSAPALPDGWGRVDAEWLSIAVPTGWDEREPINDQWRLVWSDPDTDQELSAIPGLGYYDADTARGIVATGGGLNPGGVDQTGTETVTRTDDLTLLRTTFTFDHDGRPMEGVLWVAADSEPDDRSVAVQLTGTELDADVVDQVEASIAVVDGEKQSF